MPASSPSSSSSSSQLPPLPRRSIPPLVLLSFAVLHSQVYWLYSIIYHLCNNLSDRPMDLFLDDTVLQALTRRVGRARAFSEPQQSSCVMLQQRQALIESSPRTVRPRSTTISATTVDADAPLRRQQWVQQVQACLDEQQKKKQQQQQQKLDTTIVDERLGRTRPPRWWQRTKLHLTRQDKDNDEIDTTTSSNITSTLSLPSMDFVGTSNNYHHHLTPRRPMSSSCDMQPHYHRDITTTTMRIDESTIHSDSSLFPSSLDLPSVQTTETFKSEHSATTTMESSIPPMKQQQQQQQQQQQRPRSLAKIRSVFIKSQIEPENKDRFSILNPKRKTMLGIPSRWSTSLNDSPAIDPCTKKRHSVRIKEQPLDAIISHASSSSTAMASGPKRRLFSLPAAWKRKSVG